MMEKTVWLKLGDDVEYCPYCHSANVRQTEVPSVWGCDNCDRVFIVRHRKPAPKPQSKGLSPEQVQVLRQELLAKGGC